MELSSSLEDYLEAVHMLGLEGKKVRAGDIAAKLQVSVPSVTEALKRLAKKGLVEYERYGEITLTPEGEKRAKKVYKRHRRLTDFFRFLGVDKKTAARDACRAEHVLSDKTMEKIGEFTGEGPSGEISLLMLEPRQSGRIKRLEGGATFQEKLSRMNIREGKTIKKMAAQPFSGPVVVKVGNSRISLGRGMAMKIFVEPMRTTAQAVNKR